MNLQYKGFKSTRFVLTIMCLIMSTTAFFLGNLAAVAWTDFMVSVLMIYAGSEVGAKGASAYKEKGED